jgi:hypothetical protein
MAKNNKYDAELVHNAGFRDIVHARFALSQASQRILLENPNRCYACISNNTGYTVWIKFGSEATKDQDIVIKQADRYEITNVNLWLGHVYLVAGVNQASQYIEVTEGY